ncbi:CoA-binding protein, partial [candidate division KSB1 bacterium]
MINEQLTDPKSIVIVGGSNDISKPGGKVLKNLKDGKYKGDIYVTNLKESEVQGISCYKDVNELPDVELAIVAIKSIYIPETIKILTKKKNTRAFIILSAGFSYFFRILFFLVEKFNT